MNKKQLFLWCLYDFANSLIFINFLLYFSQWLVVDGGLSDFWYNAIFAIVTVILLVTAPSLAALTDKHGGRKYFLNISTSGTFIAYTLSVIIAYGGTQNMLLSAVFFMIGQYFYQMSFIFYNPMISDISDESHRGRVSGFGQFSNSIGQVLGLVMTLSLAGSRLAPLLPAIAVFMVLSLPMMIFFKESKIRGKIGGLRAVREETKAYSKKFLAFLSMSVGTPLLVAFFFYNDALLTIGNNYPIYMERVFAVNDTVKSILLMAILVMAAIGGIVGGWVGDKLGNLRALKYILIGWIAAIPAVSVTKGMFMLYVVSICAGFLMGAAWSVSRAYLSNLLNAENMGYGFSFYTIAERFATFFGPLAWGGLIYVLGTEASSYRLAMLLMTVFVLIGFVIIVKWKRVSPMEI